MCIPTILVIWDTNQKQCCGEVIDRIDISSRTEGVTQELQIGRFHELNSAETEIKTHHETTHNLSWIIGSYTIKAAIKAVSHIKGLQTHTSKPRELTAAHFNWTLTPKMTFIGVSSDLCVLVNLNGTPPLMDSSPSRDDSPFTTSRCFYLIVQLVRWHMLQKKA